VDDLKQLSSEVQEQVRDEIEDLENHPLREDTSLVTKQGLEVFRLKLKSDALDHRVFFDIYGDTVVVLGVRHRDNAYTQESIEELKSRT